MRNIDKLKIKLANVTILLAKNFPFLHDMNENAVDHRISLLNEQTGLIMLIDELEKKDDITYFAEAI